MIEAKLAICTRPAPARKGEVNRNQGEVPWPIKSTSTVPRTRGVIVSVMLAILALIGHLSRVQYLTEYHFLLAMLAYAVLLLGVLFKGL